LVSERTFRRADNPAGCGLSLLLFSNEREEPAHIHVEQAERYAKFWLTPVSLAASYGFRSGELAELHRLVQQNSPLFLEKWNEFFGD
jgi:hypothetical protein